MQVLIEECAEGENAYLKDKIPPLNSEVMAKMNKTLDQKDSNYFQTIVHNDMHMNNVMYT